MTYQELLAIDLERDLTPVELDLLIQLQLKEGLIKEEDLIYIDEPTEDEPQTDRSSFRITAKRESPELTAEYNRELEDKIISMVFDKKLDLAIGGGTWSRKYKGVIKVYFTIMTEGKEDVYLQLLEDVKTFIESENKGLQIKYYGPIQP